MTGNFKGTALQSQGNIIKSESAKYIKTTSVELEVVIDHVVFSALDSDSGVHSSRCPLSKRTPAVTGNIDLGQCGEGDLKGLADILPTTFLNEVIPITADRTRSVAAICTESNIARVVVNLNNSTSIEHRNHALVAGCTSLVIGMRRDKQSGVGAHKKPLTYTRDVI